MDLPKGKKAIGRKWVFKVKLNSDGSIERHPCSGNRSSPANSFAMVSFSPPMIITCLFNILLQDLGAAKYCLGLEIDRSTTDTSVTQYKFVRDIIQDVGFLSSKPARTPLPICLKLTSDIPSPLINPEPYRRLVCRLLYLSFTRPDISFRAQQLSQFVYKSGQIHMTIALHLVHYLRGCHEQSLFFPASNPFYVTACCDINWSSYVDLNLSLTSYCIFLGNALISWNTKKQTTVASSTAEAEYRSLGTTVCGFQ
ncbi:UNVERIFIED_CONTAM: Retrovirus-related Pol polyprotein from transposon RE1 [Sesamum latifolium]|uniref:Retrovirus-related Pol polyprotein from transposon RE1 n=1 Tax=Sesamum latifolium TaxID=2727402 RepID=A0AAW2UFX7_9LAMI